MRHRAAARCERYPSVVSQEPGVFFSRWVLFSYAAQAGREINRKTKGKHAAEMAAYEARIGAFKFEFYPGRDKPKEEKQLMRK
jgi:hypothetical protein